MPISQETYITSSPLVHGCMMFGREREQPGILIEPQPEHAIEPHNEAALVVFRNKIWTRIEEANALAPGFAKIFKEMIIVTDPDKPLPRTAKDNIIRKQALAVYSDEIEKLWVVCFRPSNNRTHRCFSYETISASTNNYGITPPKSWRTSDLESWLIYQATSLVSQGQSISPAVDLFQQGFDR